MDQIDEFFVNRYKYNESQYIETIRPRHTLDTDAWLCDLDNGKKRYIASFNAREEGWMDNLFDIIKKTA